jgi:hypothetical protein
MNDRLVFSQPAHVVAYLLECLLAGPAAGSRRRKGGEEGLDLGQLLGGGEVCRQNLRHAAQVAIAQPKPENNVKRICEYSITIFCGLNAGFLNSKWNGLVVC